ncbi:hypothetical protein D3C76_1840530 [compost metagenome]
MPMKCCATGSRSALVRWLSGTTSVAAMAEKLQVSSSVVSRVRRDMSVISAFK